MLLSNFIKNAFCYFKTFSSISQSPISPIICKSMQKKSAKHFFLMRNIKNTWSFLPIIYPLLSKRVDRFGLATRYFRCCCDSCNCCCSCCLHMGKGGGSHEGQKRTRKMGTNHKKSLMGSSLYPLFLAFFTVHVSSSKKLQQLAND